MQAELKALNAENESLKAKMAQSALGDVLDQVVEVKGTKLLATSVDGVDMNGLRDLGDQLKDKLGEGVVVLLSAQDGKVNMIAMATDGAVKAGAHAGNLIKGIAALVGGGGGGRPNMAQAGGSDRGSVQSTGGSARIMERENLKSRLGFILLSAGCAIGIGNVWKFPYMAGQGGGGAFVLFYLIFLVILGLPIMTMEFAVGKVP